MLFVPAFFDEYVVSEVSRRYGPALLPDSS
jgi:hypothetical protein